MEKTFDIGDEVEVMSQEFFVRMAVVDEIIYFPNKKDVASYRLEVIIRADDNPCRKFITVSASWIFKYNPPKRIERNYTIEI